MENIGIYEWTVVLIGMGTVFTALVGLAWILGGFSIVAGILARKKAAGIAARSQSEARPAAAPEAGTSGITPEFVAAITAAVAASSGRAVSDIRIARISPSQSGIAGLNTPVWGYANRLAAGRR